ncbi:TssQ family T6SS-associated lipoprotein [Noviherbaspirillum malthae]|jgi:tetratricopeptide (TPR) repeat protein|uniref:TssQ family T6SS-associated lipoprotein n=1 Tax=Noviherbaspirillum malthae TaxID=1260987 RepID=UPI00188EEAFE|nr:TssQ family T6SS-associated lipoprotein [Noviherbaspirillum malthae]
MSRMKFAVALLAAAVAGCAQLPQQAGSGSTAVLSSTEAQTRYQQGLSDYRENSHDTALIELNAALASTQLTAQDAANAHKHIAFIHCLNGRELQCREQFQALLKVDPKFDLTAAESSHPQWGPVWRSTKGAMEERLALTRASSANATPAQQKLAEGIKEYDAGRYKESLAALQAALKTGLPARNDELRAHKYSAFVYCVTQRSRQCRNEFRQIFTKDADFELLPSESGHPAWASIYRGEKAAAAAKKVAPATVKKDVKKGS